MHQRLAPPFRAKPQQEQPCPVLAWDLLASGLMGWHLLAWNLPVPARPAQ